MHHLKPPTKLLGGLFIWCIVIFHKLHEGNSTDDTTHPDYTSKINHFSSFSSEWSKRHVTLGDVGLRWVLTPPHTVNPAVTVLRGRGHAADAESEEQKGKVPPPPPGPHDARAP